jgi:hypothetical protein
MDTKDFKRNSYKLLSPKTAKEGFRAVARKRRDVNVASSILNIAAATNTFQGAVAEHIHPGVQLNDKLRGAAKHALGPCLQHAVALAKVLKVKVPSSHRKIKSKNTVTGGIMDITRLGGDLLYTYVAAVNSARVVPLTAEEIAALPAPKPVAEGKKAKVAKTDKIVVDPVNVEVLKVQLSAYLAAVYEFSWLMLHGPVADVMGAHIAQITPNHPKGFFDAPPKKEMPKGLVPRKKKDAAAVVAKAEAKKAVKA